MKWLDLWKRHGVRFMKFGLVGGSGVIVNQGTLLILKEWLSLDYKLAGVIAIELSILTNFILNHFWTWRDRPVRGAGAFFLRMAKYNFSMIGTAALNWLILWGLTEHAGVVYWLSNLFGIGLVIILNYMIHHFWTFREKDDRI